MTLDLLTAWCDYLDRYGHEPGAWLALHRVRQSISAGDLDKLAQRVAVLTLPDGGPSLFRAIFLFVCTGAEDWLARARLALRQCAEIERTHCFMIFIWGWTLGRTRDRAQLRSLIERTDFPRLLRDLSTALEQTREEAGTAIAAAERPQSPPKANPIRRVAVLAQHLSNLSHPGTRLAIEHAALLRGAGVDVRVFSAQELLAVEFGDWLACPQRFHMGGAAPATWRAISGTGGFNVVLGNGAWPREGRWRAIPDKLAQFAPDVVLFVGFFSPLVSWAWKRYPVAGLSVHTLPPIGPVDVWLHSFEADQTLPAPWPESPPFLPIPYSFRLTVPEAPPASDLTALGLPHNARILVTVGYRLSREVTPQWAAEVVARLKTRPHWVWLLVGEGVYPESLPAKHPQVKVLAHQEHLDSLLQRCDVYLNPPRIGGGFSVLQAMAWRLPVVSRDGSDGGDKLGPLAMNSDAEYWQRLDRLMDDEEERTRSGQVLRERFDARYNLRLAAPSLLAALDRTREHFLERKGPER
jgi:hypothetical protein